MFGRLLTVSSFIMPVICSTLTFAHEGHGRTSGQGNSPEHYLTEPVHLTQIATVLLLAIALATIATMAVKGTQRARARWNQTA